MALETETVIDRRRLRRRLLFWRFIAVIFAVLMISVLLLANSHFTSRAGIFPSIARVEIKGTITDNHAMVQLLDRLRRVKQVKAVILAIDSPGGTAAGGEAYYMAIRRLAKVKPVVATCGTLAASAAYITALATDHIVALGNTLTGSVGVIFQWYDVTKLMNTIGVKVEEQRSGPLKAVPDPFQPADAQTRALTKQMVDDAKQWFFGLVKKRRKIDLTAVPGLTEGRVFSGREALKYKLIDQIGDQHTALQWLHDKRGIPNLPVVQWKPKSTSHSLLASLFQTMAGAFGISTQEIGSVMQAASRPLQLDGMISLWHPRSR